MLKRSVETDRIEERKTDRSSWLTFGKSFVAAALSLVLALSFVIPAAAENAGGKTVRVGWYDSHFNYVDQFGRRTGYAYEYQQKIAAYTGWNYEYVEGTWPVLMKMLEAGAIDLMSDVSYTPERTERMLFSSLPMGTESYYIYVPAGSTEIRPEDLTTFNGKRFGIFEGSVQIDFFREWADQNGVTAELEPSVISERESFQMVETGRLDGYITIDAYEQDSGCMAITKIGQSDFYFAVSKDRSDLLHELNDAMNKIQSESGYYNYQLYEKYIRPVSTSVFLSADEISWLNDHGPVRVGYRMDYLPFCDVDLATGEFTGALKEYFTFADESLKNVEFEIDPVAYASTEDALDALRNGEIDCVFPAGLGFYDAEEMGLITTSPLMKAEMYAVVKNADRQGISLQDEMRVAVVEEDINTEILIKDYFPAWKTVHFSSADGCFRAVRSGEADYCLVSNYRLYKMRTLQNQYNLSSVATGKIMNLSFALKRGSDSLYSILNKTIGLIPTAAVDAELLRYSYSDNGRSVSGFIKENSGSVIFVITTVFILIVVLLMQSLKNARRANEGEQLISATEIDPMTALYNKGYFFEYAGRMYREEPDRQMDAIVLDVEQFHAVNTLNGREFGDFVLRLLGGEIRAFLGEREGIASRFDGDHFNIYCEHMKEYQYLFDRLQNKLNEQSRNASIRIFMGVMPWQSGLDPNSQFDRAWSACNIARRSYQTRLMVYNQEMREKELLEQRLLSDLHRAVEDHEFEVYYQPKYNVQGSTPTLCSAEALVRWNHPDLGMVPPDQFIPLLERDGQISRVDHYVWEEVAKQIARWRDQYGITVPVSVNLSRLDVLDPSLEKTLEELVEKNKLDRRALKLEVTESAYTNNSDHLVSLVDRLRKKGFEIEMDDFGTSYSSLNMLSSMPVDVLKMDKAFIQNMKDDKAIHMVRLILDIAKTLKVPVVAEGVETESQMLLLKELGFALAQGYYFSQPMPPESFGKDILSQMQVS